MSIFQLKGDILTFVYDSGTSQPSTDYTGKIGFSTNPASMVTGTQYSMYISTYNNKEDDIYDIIDLLDGIESKEKIPVTGSKEETIVPSSRCALTSRGVTFIFEVLYDSQVTYDATNKFIEYKIILTSISGTLTNNVNHYFTYNYYGTKGIAAPSNGGEYQVTNTISGNGDVKLFATGSTITSIEKFEIYRNDLNNVDYYSLYELIYNTYEDSLLTIKKEGSNISHVFTATPDSKTATVVAFVSDALTSSSETFAVDDTLFFSFALKGADGSSGSSGTSGSSGSSGSSGTSGSSGSSGTSGSSGSSGTSGESGTSGSSGSSGTSGSSGSSGTSGESGTSGSSGSSGSSGTSGLIGGVEFSYQGNSSGIGNNSGKLYYDTGTNTLYISARDNNGNSVGNWITSWDDDSKGTVTLQSADGTNIVIGTITGTITTLAGTPGAYSMGFETPPVEDWSPSQGDLIAVNFSKIGDSGTSGSSGSSGTSGSSGSSGTSGSSGSSGTSGSSGSSGTSGSSGSSGSSGTSGSSGNSGTSGSSGSSGTSGSSGSSGTSGSSGSSGSSGTSGSSGSSGTSGSSGSSGTSGSSGSSGTSGSSGSSGTSGTATITNLGVNRILTSTGVQGEANAESNLTFDGSELSLTGDLEITGDIVTSGNNNIVIDPGGTGSITLKSDNIIMEGAGTTTVPELRLGEWTVAGSDYVGFKPPFSVTTSTIWTLPDGDGTANQGLATDGSDTLVWKDFILETNPVVEGTITVKPVGPSVQPAKILLKDFDNSNGITIQVPTNVTADYSLTLPADDGTSGQVLSTDGSGVLSWVTGGSGSSGSSGTSGSSGSSGTSGSSGSSGTSGSSGSSGTSGSSGSSGTSGSSGSSGTSGSSGSSGTSGTATINNNADNRIITGSATAGELNGESNLTFDGNFLDVSGRIQFQNSHGASNPSIQDTTGDYGLAIATNSTVSLVAGGSAKISMTSSGIEIFSTMDMNLNKIAFDSDSTNSYIAANTDNPEDIEIHADEDILLMADGQVGVKTTTPAYDLDVAGSIGLTGDITGNGSTLKVSEIASGIGAASAAGDKGTNAETYTAYSTTVIAGGIYYLGTSAWTISDADAASSATGLMGVATSTNSNTGMVIRGVVGVFSDPGGSVGDVCYLSTTSGRLTTTAPTAAGDIVRVMGYKIGTNLVFFNPSNDWIEL